MIKRKAQIVGGVVVNVLVADDGFTPDAGVLVDSDAAGIGWTYSGGIFTAPAEPAYLARDRLEGKLERIALRSINILRDAVIALATAQPVKAADLTKLQTMDAEFRATKTELAALP